jgi:hypothetical protein
MGNVRGENRTAGRAARSYLGRGGGFGGKRFLDQTNCQCDLGVKGSEARVRLDALAHLSGFIGVQFAQEK